MLEKMKLLRLKLVGKMTMRLYRKSNYELKQRSK